MSFATPMTELDAVNLILGSIGEPPVDNIDTEGFSEVTFAKQALDEANREIQSRGLRSNTRLLTITPDSNGNLKLPQNTLAVVPGTLNDSTHTPLAERGLLLVNAETGAEIFSSDIKVEVEVVEGLSFEQLPSYVRTFIAAHASLSFVKRQLGSGDYLRMALDTLQRAERIFSQNEMKAKSLSMMNSVSAQRVWRRSRNWGRWY